jgi:hypothetical protein
VPGEDASSQGATPIPKKVFLQPKDLAHRSAFHTSYAGDGPIHPEGATAPLHKLEFVNGVAENVDEATYQRFADLGIAGPTRPPRPGEEG